MRLTYIYLYFYPSRRFTRYPVSMAYLSYANVKMRRQYAVPEE